MRKTLVTVIIIAGVVVTAWGLSGQEEKPVKSHDAVSQPIYAMIEQGISLRGIKILPTELLEDSRCPTDATCIQVGTVRILASVFPDGNDQVVQGEVEFDLGQTVVIGSLSVTLERVEPDSNSENEISLNSYKFYFEVKEN